MTVEGPPDNFKIANIYLKIYQSYPELANIDFSLMNQGNKLDRTKTITDYGIGYKNNNYRVSVENVPQYMFGSDGIIKLMKTNGEWVYNQKMIDSLNLGPLV